MSKEKTSGVAIIGVGHHLPEQIETNEDLCRGLSVTPEWILEKTGIERRYIAAPSDTASDYSARAARQAMAMAGIEASQVDLIIACTFSGDYIFPPLSAKVHHELGVKGAQTFDLQANCAGLVAGLTVASDRMFVDDSVRYAIVVGVEFNSRYVDLRAQDPEPAARTMEMNGIATWKQAITHMPTTIRRSCERSGIATKDVDFFVFHQANLRLIEYIVRRMGVGLDRTYTNVQEIGNTGSASVAIALSEAVRKDLIEPESTVVLAAVGAGFNFGASVWRWLPRNLETAT
jgi:3-oxoacyl-[acyl-carrier-protein] synthase-3